MKDLSVPLQLEQTRDQRCQRVEGPMPGSDDPPSRSKPPISEGWVRWRCVGVPTEATGSLEPNLSDEDTTVKQVIDRLRSLQAKHAVITIGKIVAPMPLTSPTYVLDREPKEKLVVARCLQPPDHLRTAQCCLALKEYCIS
jgi:hypothetical protein